MSFSHLDDGTAESVWEDAGIADLPRLRLPALDSDSLVVVAVAHPDDETLGATGLIRTALRAGARVELVVATAGEASHPDSSTHTPEQLRALRGPELEHAADALGGDARDRLRVHRLDLPDSHVAEYEDAVRQAVAHLVQEHRERGDSGGHRDPGTASGTASPAPGTVLLVAHDRTDGHADHDAVGRAVGALAAQEHLALCEFPLWFWHWGEPAALPARRYRRLPLTPEDRRARRDALAAHASQVVPLSDAPGDEAILSPQMLTHFDRPFDCARYTGPDEADAHRAEAVFDRLYAGAEDPWRYLSSPYERRKRALTLALLTRPRYGRVVEAGASIGVLTAELAARAEHVVGLEASPRAVERAQARLADLPHAEVRRAVLPDQWPQDLGAPRHDDGPLASGASAGSGVAPRPGLDLAVVSEIGYFLQPDELDALMDRIDRDLALDGEILACHWRQPVQGWPLDGDDVHARLAADPRWRLVAEHLEADVRLALLTRAHAADHAVVVVPAKDEEADLPDCLEALAAAVDRWEEQHTQGSAAVVVVADRCTDRTVEIAREKAEEDPRFHVLEPDAAAPGEPSVGRVRDLGARYGRELFPDADPGRLWIASTDADTRVPAGWLTGTAVLGTGVDVADPAGALVLGTVDLVDADPVLHAAWAAGYEHREGHGHVHGASMGLTWARYAAAGGFPHRSEHEDVLLAEAVRGQGAPVVATDRVRVRTSARLQGRSPGGFAGYLAALPVD